jgi:Xaa-Pro aminopeptidase
MCRVRQCTDRVLDRVRGSCSEELDRRIEEAPLQNAASEVRNRLFPGEKTFEFRYGHALGYAYDDPLPLGASPFPQLYEDESSYRSDVVLAPNQLFELHPNVFVEGMAGGALGDMALVTENGYELLTHYTRELVML